MFIGGIMYSKKVIECFSCPKHSGVVKNYNCRGYVGSVDCGDALELTLKINEDEIIVDAKYRTYGCTAAMDEYLSEMKSVHKQ